jgi:very-short-patch-repair endonuclease
MNTIKQQLEISRKELLDLGLRGNTMLSFQHRAKTLEVVDELSSELYRLLVESQREMSFRPLPESIIDEKQDVPDPLPLEEALEKEYGDGRHQDRFIQTKLKPKDLNSKLLKIMAEAQGYIQEQGINVLFLALGFLNWFEDDRSDRARKAPLVLIPVELDRTSVQQKFKIAYTQADLGHNLTLSAKLKNDFQITLPEFGNDLDIDEYLDEVSTSIQEKQRWQVNHNEIALGFFSFGKFQMYQDLDTEKWPEERKPQNHALLHSLFGEGFKADYDDLGSLAGPHEDSTAKTPIDPTELYFVKDADTSQTEAILKIKQGANLVIQGPPGTGKSQTITNIISESLADGKKILFVAEKMAALDVVKRRLDECHLGDMVLELHSHKSNKRALLQELNRTLELGKPTLAENGHSKTEHRRLRTELNAYCAAVNKPVLDSETNYIDALGHLLSEDKKIGQHTLPTLDFKHLRQWDQRAYLNACAQVQELIEHLQQMGVPSQSVFAKSTLTPDQFSPVQQSQLSKILSGSLLGFKELVQLSDDFSRELGLESPQTLSDIELVNQSVQFALTAPNHSEVAISHPKWQTEPGAIRELIDAGSKMNTIYDQWEAHLIDQAWSADLLEERTVYATTGQKWWRFLSGRFRRAKQSLQGLMKTDLPRNGAECLELVDDILQYQSSQKQYTTHEALGQSLFGTRWSGVQQSNWVEIQSLGQWTIGLHSQVGSNTLPQEIIQFLEDKSAISNWHDRASRLNHLIEKLKNDHTDILNRMAIDTDQNRLFNQRLDEIETRLFTWHDQLDRLNITAQYNQLCLKIQEHRLETVATYSYDWEKPHELLLSILKKSWYEGLVEEAYQQHDAIKLFEKTKHENKIDRFKALDNALFRFAQEDLVLKHFDSLPAIDAPGEMGILRHEMNKKRRHKPIRRLIQEAGRVIQQIKPVFMMSPMSVATYLPEGAIEFDLVVFDEASQVKVVEALGSIMRGKQVVVVGDTKQMPPTNFFSKVLELDDDEAEESQTADIESILGMFLSKGAPQAMLRWHYRSRHESLINVSNHEFYDGRLMIFPSPGMNTQAKGLSFRHFSDTTYDRGGSRTNAKEARAVAEAVMAHATNHPDLTLGVVAFSTAQREAILEEVERLRREDPSHETFFATGGQNLESFFVKNLENVQGDERDVILISIGYGRTVAGKLSNNFGPLNKTGGERRLNVLITRARLAMVVFCNFTANEMTTDANSPHGVRALKSFLHFAETGEFEHIKETGREIDSPFEEDVLSEIRRMGYEAEPQIGSAGFFIDMAVRDPQQPGRYVLAVECDGASYHSSASARARDRLRQSVLEGLGWRFHRIWSSDWFRNRTKEIALLKESIEESIRYHHQASLGLTPANDSIQEKPEFPKATIERSASKKKELTAVGNYVMAKSLKGIRKGSEIHELNQYSIANALKNLVEKEGPVHIEIAIKRITNVAGYARAGQRIKSHIQASAKYAHQEKTIYMDNDFIYADESKPAKIRNRSKLTGTDKKLDWVSPEELGQALHVVITYAYSISADDAMSEALSMLGFQKLTAKSKTQVEPVLDMMIQQGCVVRENGKLRIPS